MAADASLITAEPVFLPSRVSRGDRNNFVHYTAAKASVPPHEISLGERSRTRSLAGRGCPAHYEPGAVIVKTDNESAGEHRTGAPPPHCQRILSAALLLTAAASSPHPVNGLAAGMYTATNTVGPADGNHNPLWPAFLKRIHKVEAGTPKSFASGVNPSQFRTLAASGRGQIGAFPGKAAVERNSSRIAN